MGLRQPARRAGRPRVRSRPGPGELTAVPDAPAPPPAPEVAQLHEILLHGHRVFYRAAGIGPVVVLVHGITSTSATWAHVLYRFPEHCERLVLISSGGLGR